MSKEIFGRQLNPGDYVLVPVFSELRVARIKTANMEEYQISPTEKRTWLKIRVGYVGTKLGQYDHVARTFPAIPIIKYSTYDDKTVALLTDEEARAYIPARQFEMLQSIKIKV